MASLNLLPATATAKPPKYLILTYAIGCAILAAMAVITLNQGSDPAFAIIWAVLLAGLVSEALSYKEVTADSFGLTVSSFGRKTRYSYNQITGVRRRKSSIAVYAGKRKIVVLVVPGLESMQILQNLQEHGLMRTADGKEVPVGRVEAVIDPGQMEAYCNEAVKTLCDQVSGWNRDMRGITFAGALTTPDASQNSWSFLLYAKTNGNLVSVSRNGKQWLTCMQPLPLVRYDEKQQLYYADCNYRTLLQHWNVDAFWETTQQYVHKYGVKEIEEMPMPVYSAMPAEAAARFAQMSRK